MIDPTVSMDCKAVKNSLAVFNTASEGNFGKDGVGGWGDGKEERGGDCERWTPGQVGTTSGSPAVRP
jgi:hypothetical protein